MLRLSIQARQALAKLSLPLFIAGSLCVMLVGRADQPVADGARMAIADALAPLYASVAVPLATARRGAADALGIIDLVRENAKLRAENARLRRWYEVAIALEAENATLKENLHWLPDPSPSFVTGRVVADVGGVYARAVLVYLGPTDAVRRGQVALDAAGLVGRVTAVGTRSARVLLITDEASRIPVSLPREGVRGIMVGTDGPVPKLLYLPDGTRLHDGDPVVTSDVAGAFPAGLPIGTVRLERDRSPAVVPSARLDELTVLRLFDYKLGRLAPPAGSPVSDTAGATGAAPGEDSTAGAADAATGARAASPSAAGVPADRAKADLAPSTPGLATPAPADAAPPEPASGAPTSTSPASTTPAPARAVPG